MEYLIVDFVSHSDDYIKSLKGSPTALLSDTVRGRIQTTWTNEGGLLLCNSYNVTTMKSLGIFSRNLRGDFFLKIGIFSVKV